MLSYDNPVSINGQPPASPTNITTNRLAMVSSKPVRSSKIADRTMNGNTAKTPELQLRPAHHHVWLVTGPAGCGKTTVAQYVANKLDLPYIEGDDFHPAENVAKMASGQPLTDADRWDWLTRLREEALTQVAAGHDGVVVTCSALKRKYRDVIRVAKYFSPDLQLHFIYLDAPEAVLQERVANRKGHYMGASMVHSQLAVLEPPMPDEHDCICVDVTPAPETVCEEALSRVVSKLASDL
ncbi:hypothetical protein N0V93_003648 [Gnomoniopsis smithogilvyi]|uniref:Gluconokinase n=1 Tax=Gnomoniopsis smithogilvyi TaxID=1191159 RepID=A0A9W8Z161_9PEZI|nr:hypothetical protein N0V93_003648 [Gnomoniopsis smithogilvyi]